jgi:hypothetical protein
MSTRWARFARGWIAAMVSLFVAACSHSLAGGTLPATVGLALCLAFSALVCVLLAGRTLSLARLSIGVTLSQLMFHGLFSLLADAPLAAASSAGAGMHHGVDGLVLQFGSATSDAASMTGSLSASMTAEADLRMWAGHAIGAFVTIAALGYGERVFWGLLRLAHLCISRLFDAVLPVETAVSAPLSRNDHPAAVIPRALVFSIHRHRGPPAVAIAL